jgi:hypothetical protein
VKADSPEEVLAAISIVLEKWAVKGIEKSGGDNVGIVGFHQVSIGLDVDWAYFVVFKIRLQEVWWR